jgi:hypothetical protein
MRLFVFSLLIAAAAAQSVNPTPSPAEPPKKARVEGSVVSLTGEPIPRATLRLQGFGTSLQSALSSTATTATADDTGKFAFQDVEPGNNYRLSAQRPGYVPAQYGARAGNTPGSPISLAEGQVLKGLTITMTPQGTISGKITDKNNDPIQGARVVAMTFVYQRGVRALMPGSNATTDDKGEYRISNLAPGRYYIEALDRGATDLAATGGPTRTEGSVMTYYPSATDSAGAAPVMVTPGAELRGIDIRIRSARLFTVHGKAVNVSSGAPAAGVLLRSAPAQQDASQTVMALLTVGTSQTAQDGSFELRNVTSGSWTITAISIPLNNGGSTPRLSGNVTVDVGERDVAGVVLQLGPAAGVAGAIRIEGGDIKAIFPTPAQTPNTAQVINASLAGLAASASRPTVGLFDVLSGGLAGLPSRINEDGTFKIEGINPGRFAVMVTALPQGYYVKSVRFGGADVTHAALDLTSAAGGSLDVLVSDKGSEVSGSVHNEKNESMAGLIVALWTKDPELGSPENGVRTASADQNGSFQFKGLPPGEYYLAAWEDAEAAQLQNRDLLAMFSDNDAKIKLGEGSKQSTEAKLITSEKLAAAVAKLP